MSGSPAWPPHAMFAQSMSGITAASLPLVHGPKLSPISQFTYMPPNYSVEPGVAKRRRRWIAASILIPLVGVVLWATWHEPSSLRTEVGVMALEELPESCRGLRVALIADLHVGSPFNGIPKLERVVAQTLAAEPDLVLLLGDFVIQGVFGGRFVPPDTTAALLAQIDAPMGTYAVLGNHDWWFSAGQVREAFESVGIPVLEDQAREVSSPDCSLWIAGIGDFWEGAHDVEAALSGIPAEVPVIAFTHNPDIFPDVPERVMLTVAGHTHGGQVRLPFFGRPVVPSRYGELFAAGHVVQDDRDLVVTTGVGTSILPVRFRVPPVVTILELEPLELETEPPTIP